MSTLTAERSVLLLLRLHSAIFSAHAEHNAALVQFI
jgi:hypothetical protein